MRIKKKITFCILSWNLLDELCYDRNINKERKQRGLQAQGHQHREATKITFGIMVREIPALSCAAGVEGSSTGQSRNAQELHAAWVSLMAQH